MPSTVCLRGQPYCSFPVLWHVAGFGACWRALQHRAARCLYQVRDDEQHFIGQGRTGSSGYQAGSQSMLQLNLTDLSSTSAQPTPEKASDTETLSAPDTPKPLTSSPSEHARKESKMTKTSPIKTPCSMTLETGACVPAVRDESSVPWCESITKTRYTQWAPWMCQVKAAAQIQ